jgi:hypothetical protein
MQKLWVKTMLTAFFGAKRIIHHEFVPEKETVNGKFYEELIKRLNTRVHRVRLEFSGKRVMVPSARHCTGAFFGRCLRVFGETRDPHIIPSTLLP